MSDVQQPEVQFAVASAQSHARHENENHCRSADDGDERTLLLDRTGQAIQESGSGGGHDSASYHEQIIKLNEPAIKVDDEFSETDVGEATHDVD